MVGRRRLPLLVLAGSVNREELLQSVFGLDPDAYVPGAKVVEAHDGSDVVAHADIYWRRVIVHQTTGMAGESSQTVATTVQRGLPTVGLVHRRGSAAERDVDPVLRLDGQAKALVVLMTAKSAIGRLRTQGILTDSVVPATLGFNRARLEWAARAAPVATKPRATARSTRKRCCATSSVSGRSGTHRSSSTRRTARCRP